MFTVRSIPNWLGLFRILATPLLMWLILQQQATAYMWAAGLLLVMAVSDLIDGHLARKLKVVSRLGVFLDTISDKVFVAGALLALIQADLLSVWLGLIIIGREFIISGLRSFAASEGVVMAAGVWGKQKLTITVVALIWLLLAAAGDYAGLVVAFDGPPLGILLSLWVVPMAMAVIWTILSATDYLWQAWPLLRRGWFPPTTVSPERRPTPPTPKDQRPAS